MRLQEVGRQLGVWAHALLRLNFVVPLIAFGFSACTATRQPAEIAEPQIGPGPPAGDTWPGSPAKLASQALPQQPLAFIECRVLYAAYGLEQYPGQRVAAASHQAHFTPSFGGSEAASLSGLAYALWCFDMTYFEGPAVVTLDWEGAAPADDDVYIGLGDFAKDCWEWRQPQDSVLELVSLDRYIDEDLRLLLTVVLTGDQPATLNYVRIGGTCVVGGVDLTLVFPPPMSYELQTTCDDWAGRDPTAHNFQFIDEEVGADGFRWQVVSHEVDGYTHYGAVRIPAGAPDEQYFVAVHCHPGAGGCSLYEPGTFDMLTGETGLRDRFIVIAPSFRGEDLRTDTLGNFHSDAPPSVYDRDADDAIALLDCVLRNYSEVDPRLIVAYGLSRGAQVSTRMGERDPRINAVIAYCGFTDEWSVDAQAYMFYNIGEISDSEPDPSDFYPHVMWDLRFGSGDVFEARRSLLLTSTAPFADSLPLIHLHYGELDPVMPIRHGERLDALLTYFNKPHEFFRYPNGGHEMFVGSGGDTRFQELLQQLVDEVEAD